MECFGRGFGRAGGGDFGRSVLVEIARESREKAVFDRLLVGRVAYTHRPGAWSGAGVSIGAVGSGGGVVREG